MGVSSVPAIPTLAEVDAIVALQDPVIRNLQITQCYHELAAALARRLGSDANWCSFATWASKQAGQTIRKEDFAHMLENALHRAPTAHAAMPDVVASAQALGSTQEPEEIQESVWRVVNPLAALDRASDGAGRGNHKVFMEIGREFARFEAEFLDDTAFDADKIAAFCEALRPGDPPDGQGYLRQAFTHYYRALFEADPKTRAELMFLANIEIGFHEQTRLQPEIEAAMNAAFIDRREFRERLIKAMFPRRGWLARARLFFLRLFDRPSPLDAIIDPLLAETHRQARLLITEYMMSIRLPGDVLIRLSDDLPVPFPDLLKTLAFADLLALLDIIDPTPDSAAGSGAFEWSDLMDRIHFIIDFFRCYHTTANLFDPPFLPDQVTALKAGRRPNGRL